MKTQTDNKREEKKKRRRVRTEDKRKKRLGGGRKERGDKLSKKGARSKGDRGTMTREKKRARTRKRVRNKIGLGGRQSVKKMEAGEQREHQIKTTVRDEVKEEILLRHCKKDLGEKE